MSKHYTPAEVIRVLADDARDERFIGKCRAMEAYEDNGIVVLCGDGMSIVYAPVNPEYHVKPWFLTLAAGIAIDVPDVDGALAWCNSRNRQLTIGRYLCCIDAVQQMAAVIYTESVSSRIFGSEEVWSYLTGLMTVMAKTSASEPAEFIGQYGCQPFSHEIGEWALTMLAL